MEGKVKFFNRGKGFGFIQGDDGKDYFVHYTAVEKGVFLNENDRVSFEPVEGDRGWKAENVKLSSGSSAPESSEDEAGEESGDETGEDETSEEAGEESDEDETSEESEDEEKEE